MSKKTKLAIAKVSIPGTQSDELCYVFAERLDPNNPSSDTVFGIFQIRSSSEAYHTIIERIVKHILDFYYRAKENSGITDGEQAVGAAEFLFENALQYANDHTVSMIEEMRDSTSGRVQIDRTRISLLIGAISGQELFLTSTGNAVKAYMLYPVSRDNTFSHYSAVAVTDENQAERNMDSKKLFTNVIAGTFAIPGSTLVVCNDRFNDYIPMDQVKQVVTSYPFDHLTKYLYNLLGKANDNADFNALFLSLQETDSSDRAGGHRQTRSDDSMNELVEQQKNTQSILSPAMASHMKERLAHFVTHNVIQPAKGLRDNIQNVDYQKHARSLRLFGKKVSIGARKSVSAVKKNYKNPIPVIKKEIQSPKTKKTIAIWTKRVSEFYGDLREKGLPFLAEWFRGLSMLSKGLLALAVIFILLFTVSVVGLHRKNASNAQAEGYAAQVRSLTSKVDQAESSMIFEDNDRATALLADAQKALKDLPRTNADQIATADKLAARIDAATQKIRKVYPVQATSVAQLDNQIPTLDSIDMVASENTVLVYNTDSIYKLSRADGKVTQLNTQAKIPSIGCAAAQSDDVFFFCADQGGDRMYQVSIKDDSAKQITVKRGAKETISHITIFNNRLYVLDPLSNMIYRHSSSKDGFAAPIEWFAGTKDANLADGRQMIIDGTAYILKAGAAFAHVTSNKATNLSFGTIDPALTNADHFWTEENSNSLYILDATNKRIVVVDKATNKVIAQLTSDQLANAKTLSVFEKKKEILVLTPNSIISIPIAFAK